MIDCPATYGDEAVLEVGDLVIEGEFSRKRRQGRLLVAQPRTRGADGEARGPSWGSFPVGPKQGLEILRLNKKSETPLNMYLIRYSDTLISLSDRTELAKALNADLFISLHCNHSHNPTVRGIEVYIDTNESRNSKESTWFAYQLQNKIKKHLGFESRGVKLANFQVLRETINYFPSVLVELGFLSNGDESSYYQRPESYQVLALVIWESLIRKYKSYERVGE